MTRLSDRQVCTIIAVAQWAIENGTDEVTLAAHEAESALAELRDRRSRDLTNDDVEALRALCFLLSKHSHEPYAYDGEECDRALAVLSNLIGGRDA